MRILYASNNNKITTVKPFANSLIELNASCDCGIVDERLIDAINLKVLYAFNNNKITKKLH